MKQLAQIVGSFWRDEDGQDLLEYALLVALIALVAVAGVTAAGVRVKDIFNAIVAAIPLPGSGVSDTVREGNTGWGRCHRAAPVSLPLEVICDYCRRLLTS